MAKSLPVLTFATIMECTTARLPYRETGSFSKIAVDYADAVPALAPFISHRSDLKGIQDAITERKKFNTNRELLVTHLQKQYSGVTGNEKTKLQIASLLDNDTFTITTAHQNNIFTGPLYFIYKIVHAIKLADELKISFPQQHFVPVFYIGSEDADVDELNHIFLGGEKLTWNTAQKGAVGRMTLDKEVNQLLRSIEGQLTVLPHGNEIVSLLKKYYREGVTLQQATFEFVHELFSSFGLIVLLPDDASLKSSMISLFADDLLHQSAAGMVGKTADSLHSAGYKVQAHPREINLFYLKDQLRERIERSGNVWNVINTDITFTEEQLIAELNAHPEHFSPNVILRGLYQETILPNIAFIGGGGETAYWLQLKDLFEYYHVPYPVLILRNSFLLVEKKWKQKVEHLGFTIPDFFNSADHLLNKLVAKESPNQTKLNGSLSALQKLYDEFKVQATAIDMTLEKHVDALKVKTVSRLLELEKKMLRAEKRKFTDQQRQIQVIKQQLFPGNGLQERKENVSYYYARYGRDFLQMLYDESPSLEQEFVIVSLP